MTNKNTTIQDMSIYEASDFWDEHEFSEYDDVQEVHDFKFDLHRKKYIGIDLEMYERITGKAKALHTTADHLIETWLSEKVNA